MAKTAGETLLEKMKEQPPEGDEEEVVSEVPDEPVAEEPPPKRTRRRKAEPETPAEEAVAIEEERVETDETPEWMQRLQSELGIENPESPEDAVARAIEIARENERAAEEAMQWRRENEPFASYGREHYKPAPQETKDEAPKPWQVMSYPQEAETFITGRNQETGEIEWKANTPNEVKLRVEQWQGTEAQHGATLVRPDLFWKQMQEFFEAQFTEKAQPFYEERTKEQQREQFFDDYRTANHAWLFTRDPRTGSPTKYLSQSGEFFDERVGFHLERGHTPQDAIRYAQYDYQEQTGETPWAKQNGTHAETQPSIEDVREQQRKEHQRRPLKGAQRTPTRKGSFTEPEDETPQNDNLSFGQRVIQKRDMLGVTANPASSL